MRVDYRMGSRGDHHTARAWTCQHRSHREAGGSHRKLYREVVHARADALLLGLR